MVSPLNRLTAPDGLAVVRHRTLLVAPQNGGPNCHGVLPLVAPQNCGPNCHGVLLLVAPHDRSSNRHGSSRVSEGDDVHRLLVAPPDSGLDRHGFSLG